jgi:hypothetical protein
MTTAALTTAALMTTSVFPIGHYAGLRPDDDGRPVHAVRIGWQQHRLSEAAFGTWVLGHGTPQVGKGPWTREDLVAAALEAGITDPGTHAEELTGLGLLAKASEASEEFAKAHRIDVQFVGLGNSLENPDLYAVGLPGLGTAATLDPSSYELWQWGSVPPTLWHSCQVRASVAGSSEPADALAGVLGDLRYLIAHGCAYVDVADPR